MPAPTLPYSVNHSGAQPAVACGTQLASPCLVAESPLREGLSGGERPRAAAEGGCQDVPDSQEEDEDGRTHLDSKEEDSGDLVRSVPMVLETQFGHDWDEERDIDVDQIETQPYDELETVKRFHGED